MAYEVNVRITKAGEMQALDDLDYAGACDVVGLQDDEFGKPEVLFRRQFKDLRHAQRYMLKLIPLDCSDEDSLCVP